MVSHGRLILSTPGEPEQEFMLGGQVITLGRAPTNEIVIKDAKASREHAKILLEKGSWTLLDLNSSNGTRLNGQLVERAMLEPGSVISIGNSNLRYELDPGFELTLIENIDSEAELDATLLTSSINSHLGDTSLTRLVVNTPDKTWEVPFTSETLTIGRGSQNDVVLDDPKVSRQHAILERKGKSFILRDLNSSNGTFFRGLRVESQELLSNDSFQIGDANLVLKKGFQLDELTMVEVAPSKPKSLRRPVVFVPGIMGSELWRGSEKVWPRVRQIFTNPELLSLPDFRPITVGEIVREVVIVPNLVKQDQYNLMGDYLVESLGYQRQVNFLEFAYDWRQDVRDSARALGGTIEEWDVEPPITIIAHSLGTLVSRYYIEKLGGKDVIERIILLGAPNDGVPFAMSTLFKGPDILPFGLLGERLREVLSTFPSAYQILPTIDCVIDQNNQPIKILEDLNWLPEEQRPYLRLAAEFRHELGNTSSIPTVSIFGYGIETVNKIRVQRNSQGVWENIEFETQPNGDDRITQGSAVLSGSEIHPVQQHHGKLFVDNDVRMRLKIELMRDTL